MSRPKYLWRVTADYGTYKVVRHYQSERAAVHRRSVWKDGIEIKGTYDHMNGPSGDRYVPPAFSVRIEKSERIVFPHG